MNFNIDQATILKVQHGSWAYGTNVEGSDRDFKGVAIPPLRYFVGFAEAFEQHETKDPDCVIYDVRKFCRLAINSNPNILETLWAPDDLIIKCTPEGEALRKCADMFLSKRAVGSFCGYAHAQLKRIKSHKRWLLDPPSAPPQRKDFGIPENNKAIAPDTMGAIEHLLTAGVSFSGEILNMIEREKAYARAHAEWNNFQNWKATRNEARAVLEARHGYDTKHAMHLVRLMTMCKEILGGKGVIVRRPDADLLKAIRAGAWTYDQLMTWAEDAEAEARALEATSSLRHHPDVAALDALCQEVVAIHHKEAFSGAVDMH